MFGFFALFACLFALAFILFSNGAPLTPLQVHEWL